MARYPAGDLPLDAPAECICPSSEALMTDHGSDKSNLALGMKVSVRCGVRERIGVVTRLDIEHVTVQWLQSDEGVERERQVRRVEVTPLSEWI
jgi:hypothetical protein